MSACSNCGRPVGTDSGLGECTWLFGRVCIDAARTRPTHDALRRELADAKAEVERLRAEVSDMLAERDGYSAACTMSVRELAVEVDELRRLAWEWCFGAVALRERLELVDAGIGEIIATRDAAVARTKELEAERAGPLPTAVLAHTEPPIESLGPVPECVPGNLRRCVEWLVRDAVRRGAKMEGDDR